MVLAARRSVLVCHLPYAAESKERLKSQDCLTVCIHQRVAYKDAVLIMLEHHLLLKQHAAHAINRSRHLVAIELADILMPFGAVIVTLVLVQSKVELRAVLDYRDIQRGKQHMVVFVHTRNGHNKQAVVFAGIAIHDCRARISPRTVCTQQLP